MSTSTEKKKPNPPNRKHRLRTGERMDRTTGTMRPRHKEPLWVPLFLDHLAREGLVTAACQSAGIDLSRVYQYRQEHQSFGQRWDAALEKASDALEVEARRRACEGIVENVYGNLGKAEGGRTGVVGKRKRYSDNLLMFLLKHNRPHKFRENVAPANPGPETGKGYVTVSPDDWPEPNTTPVTGGVAQAE